MRVLCLIEKVEGNQITLYNPETQNNITLSVPDDEIDIYESALKEAEDESLFVDDFNEPALALVYYDTETENISFEGEW
ncbi:hypothetical protein [Aerococcus viridans]